jgi:hypothetical protein
MRRAFNQLKASAASLRRILRRHMAPPDFSELYRSCNRRGVLKKSAEDVQAHLAGLTASTVLVERCNVVKGFRTIEGFRVTIDGKVAAFPRSLQDYRGESGVTRMRRDFLRVDLVVPAYVSFQYLSQAAAAIEKLGDNDDLEQYASLVLEGMFGANRVADLCLGVYKTNNAVAPYFDHVVESVKAHFLGLNRAAINTLIPCVEGIIRNIGAQLGDTFAGDVSREYLLKTLRSVQDCYIRKCVYAGFDWVPAAALEPRRLDNFDEPVQIIESVRYFIEQSLYVHTDRYSKRTGLNRPGIAHALISHYDTPANFYRLLALINALSVASIFAGHAASLLGPSPSVESRALAEEFKACKNFAQRSPGS